MQLLVSTMKSNPCVLEKYEAACENIRNPLLLDTHTSSQLVERPALTIATLPRPLINVTMSLP